MFSAQRICKAAIKALARPSARVDGGVPLGGYVSVLEWGRGGGCTEDHEPYALNGWAYGT